MSVQENVASKTAYSAPESEFPKTVTVGNYSIEVMLPKATITGQQKTWCPRPQIFIPVPPPRQEHLDELTENIEDLKDPEHPFREINGYLPSGTIFSYYPTDWTLTEIPDKVELSEDIGGENLESVMEIIELWLNRKLGGVK